MIDRRSSAQGGRKPRINSRRTFYSQTRRTCRDVFHQYLGQLFLHSSSIEVSNLVIGI